MLRRTFFIPAVFMSLVLLHFWSRSIATQALWTEMDRKILQNEASVTLQRQELLESLHLLVTRQEEFQQLHGHYTKLLDRTGFEVPEQLRSVYQIQVLEASSERLLVQALSDSYDRPPDRVTIDQGFRVQANFQIPEPRAVFLRAEALKHARLLQSSKMAGNSPEHSIYPGYFRYDIREDSLGNRTVFAIGIQPPVVDVHLDASERTVANDEGESQKSGVISSPRTNGRSPSQIVVEKIDNP